MSDINTLKPGKRYKFVSNEKLVNCLIYNEDLLDPTIPAFPFSSLCHDDIVVLLEKASHCSGENALKVLTTCGVIGWVLCGSALKEV